MYLNNKRIFVLYVFIVLCLRVYAQANHALPLPKLDYGMATFSGSISGQIPADVKISDINITVTNAVTYFKDYKVPVRQDGTFSITIPAFGITHGYINSAVYEGNIILLANEETTLDVMFNVAGEKVVNVTEKFGIGSDDLQTMGSILGAILNDDQKVDSTFGAIENGEDFIRYSSRYLQIAKEQVSEQREITNVAKEMLNYCLTTFLFKQLFLDYYGAMKRRYIDRNDIDNSIEYDKIDYRAPEIDSSYFSFFRGYDLNSPYYFFSTYLQPFFQQILMDETLSIPALHEHPFDEWMSQVRLKLVPSIGTDTGLFYDLLVANAYVRQLYELRPLDDQQKRDIKKYFADQAYVDFLFDENERTVQLMAENRKSSKVLIRETPKVPVEQLMESILRQYKEKVVVVDFWATWCVPCLEAFKLSTRVKREFEPKDVVFVYFTTTSSPPKVWEEKIGDIGGEHYYLDDREWGYLLDNLGFSQIPTYLIYDKSGKKRYQRTGFMGADNMEKWINECMVDQ